MIYILEYIPVNEVYMYWSSSGEGGLGCVVSVLWVKTKTKTPQLQWYRKILVISHDVFASCCVCVMDASSARATYGTHGACTAVFLFGVVKGSGRIFGAPWKKANRKSGVHTLGKTTRQQWCRAPVFSGSFPRITGGHSKKDQSWF